MGTTKIYYIFEECNCVFIEDDVPQWSNLPPLTRERIKKKVKRRIYNTMKVCPVHGTRIASRYRQCTWPDCETIITSTRRGGEMPIRCKEHTTEAKVEQRRRSNANRKYTPAKELAAESAAFPPVRYTDCKYYDDCVSVAAHKKGGKLKCKGCQRYEHKSFDMSEIQPREWSEQTCYI